MSRRRIYVGNLSSRTRERDLEYDFDRYGRIERLDLKNGFAFIEYADARDAEDAVRDMHDRTLDGRRISVEFARDNKAARRPRGGGGGNGYRIKVENLDSRTSWQDLKDFARKAGPSVVYTDVFVDRGQKFGVIEYSDKDDYKDALKSLDDRELDGKRVRLLPDEKSGGRSRSPSPRRSRSKSPRRARSRSPRRDDGGRSDGADAPRSDDAPRGGDMDSGAPAAPMQ